jgi:hypothetical protein
LKRLEPEQHPKSTEERSRCAYNELSGSKTIPETSGAKVVLEWDLKRTP